LLPKFTGDKIMNFLSADPQMANIPVIALSNVTNPEIVNKVIKLGAKEFLSKPMYTPEEIVKRIKKHL